MAEDIRAFLEKWKIDNEKMKQLTPELMVGFGGLFQKVMKEGVLSVKQKELIALAIGLAVQCEPCIILHVKKCLEAGATNEEILEAASVVVMMQGGPSYTHIPVVIDALEELTG
jgi:AhpD family alkylhydroperoxidase